MPRTFTKKRGRKIALNTRRKNKKKLINRMKIARGEIEQQNEESASSSSSTTTCSSSTSISSEDAMETNIEKCNGKEDREEDGHVHANEDMNCSEHESDDAIIHDMHVTAGQGQPVTQAQPAEEPATDHASTSQPSAAAMDAVVADHANSDVEEDEKQMVITDPANLVHSTHTHDNVHVNHVNESSDQDTINRDAVSGDSSRVGDNGALSRDPESGSCTRNIRKTDVSEHVPETSARPAYLWPKPQDPALSIDYSATNEQLRNLTQQSWCTHNNYDLEQMLNKKYKRAKRFMNVRPRF